MVTTLVVATHPDDETLGCGGTLLKHNSNNDEIYWLLITKATKEAGYSQNFIKKRSEEIKAVEENYNIKKTFNLEFPVTRLDTFPLSDIIKKIANVFNKVQPEIIYIPNRSDVHSDHRVTFDAVMSCTKSFRFPYIKRVLMYETISETEFSPALRENSFQPNSFCDISDHIEDKLEILKIYESEIGEHPFPRSEENVRALSKFRGAMIGVNYAEAFMILKEVF